MRKPLGVILAALVCAFALWTGDAHAAPGRSAVTRSDQKDMSITIYNGNLGLVKDVRELQLPAGIHEVKFMDVASQIDPTTVHLKSLTDPSGVRILEQNYEYDLLNPQKLLDKYVGKSVKLMTGDGTLVEAVLLSNNNGPIYQINGQIHLGHPGRVILPQLPEDLIPNPTLVWRLQSNDPRPQRVEASYLTSGITWKADYVVILNAKDTGGDLSGWVTIENKSGATYADAVLKLVAGDVHRAPARQEVRGVLESAAKAAAPRPQFQEESFFEYHLYSLQGGTTIKQNQTKQISLITAQTIPVKKELRFYGARHYYRDRQGEMISNQKVGVFVEIRNKEENNLGIPLPKGTLRVYKHDREGSQQFVGEDSIDHTPKDETVKIKLGDAFDVVGSRKQTDWKKIAYDTYEASFEISLRNHKKEDVVVRVIEPIPGDWMILNTSHEYSKTNASTAEFNIKVPRDKETKLTYRVRIRF